MGCHSVEETLFVQPVDASTFKAITASSTTITTATTMATPVQTLPSSGSNRRVSSKKKPYSKTNHHHRLSPRTQDSLLTPPTTPPPASLSRSAKPPSVTVDCQVRARVPTSTGELFLHLYKNNRDNKEHLAIVFGDDIRSKSLDAVHHNETEMDRIIRGAYTGRLRPGQTRSDESGSSPLSSPSSVVQNQPPPPLVRIHSECFTGETVQSARCDCGEQLEESMRLIQQEGRGVIVYLRQEGRGIGLAEKLRAYNLQDLGHDTVTANLLLHHPPDLRTYDVAIQILVDLSLTKIRLLTNNPDKIEQIEGDGSIKVVERVPMVPLAWQQHEHDPNRRGNEVDQYLKVKVERMRHLLNVPESLLR